MMINKRLIHTVENSKKYIVYNVIAQWVSLLANVVLMGCIASLLGALLEGNNINENGHLVQYIIVILAAVLIRFGCTILSSKMSYLSSKAVKRTLREKIFNKLLKLGTSYKEKVKTSEIVQVTVEGVEQLETYFGAYLPQFFYAMIAPLTLFILICFINVPAALILFICVPLIPVSIAVVQTWAKKLLSKYWGQYTALGDTFLENLQGLTTLKIYQADEFKNKEMNQEAEKFRKITMKVLTMQLNSITIMDLIAYGGAALGIIVGTLQFRAGHMAIAETLFIILLSADFFIPMRQLGSFFHIAMNGMAASDKIFNLLDFSENETGGMELLKVEPINVKEVSYSYDGERTVLNKVNMQIPEKGLVSIVGESGCGKSTLAGILTGKNKAYLGSITIGQKEVKDLSEESLLKHVTYIGHQSYLFKGTVRENLLMGIQQETTKVCDKNFVTDELLWDALDKVNLSEFIKEEGGLDMKLNEQAGNLSGGQCQRLAMARALLHNSDIYVFDEATSNIDVESENDIMKEVHRLAEEKCVILISHRLANVVSSQKIYVMDQGCVVASGLHKDLEQHNGIYAKLWNTQHALETFGMEAN